MFKDAIDKMTSMTFTVSVTMPNERQPVTVDELLKDGCTDEKVLVSLRELSEQAKMLVEEETCEARHEAADAMKALDEVVQMNFALQSERDELKKQLHNETEIIHRELGKHPKLLSVCLSALLNLILIPMYSHFPSRKETDEPTCILVHWLFYAKQLLKESSD